LRQNDCARSKDGLEPIWIGDFDNDVHFAVEGNVGRSLELKNEILSYCKAVKVTHEFTHS